MASIYNAIVVVILLCAIESMDSIEIDMCSGNCKCFDQIVRCDGCISNMTIIGYEVISFTVNNCDNGDVNKMILLSRISNRTNYSKNDDFTNQDFSLVDLTLKNDRIKYLKYLPRLKRLRRLDISFNNITTLPNNIFQNVSYIDFLNLQSNQIQTIFNESFANLTKLTFIDLSYNNLKIINDIFSPLKSLQHLNLSFNDLETLPEKCFENLWLLQHLDISYNKLMRVAPGALQFLPNLARLLLAHNPRLGTAQTDTQLLVGTGRRLQQVDASKTGLLQIPEALTHSVRFLSLSGNKISIVERGDLDSYPLLQILDFSENNITIIEDDALGRSEMLLELYLNNNKLNSIPKMLPDELRYLSINNNILKKLFIIDFTSLSRLRTLLLRQNLITNIEENAFVQLVSLEVLDLSYNPLKILTPSTFNGPLSLKELKLCNLNVSLPAKDISFPVLEPEGLKILRLKSSPGIAQQLLADSAVLAAMSHLEFLDLRFTKLSSLRNDLLYLLPQLKVLKLGGNNINCTELKWLHDWMNYNNSENINSEQCEFSTSQYNDLYSDSDEKRKHIFDFLDNAINHKYSYDSMMLQKIYSSNRIKINDTLSILSYIGDIANVLTNNSEFITTNYAVTNESLYFDTEINLKTSRTNTQYNSSTAKESYLDLIKKSKLATTKRYSKTYNEKQSELMYNILKVPEKNQSFTIFAKSVKPQNSIFTKKSNKIENPEKLKFNSTYNNEIEEYTYQSKNKKIKTVNRAKISEVSTKYIKVAEKEENNPNTRNSNKTKFNFNMLGKTHNQNILSDKLTPDTRATHNGTAQTNARSYSTADITGWSPYSSGNSNDIRHERIYIFIGLTAICATLWAVARIKCQKKTAVRNLNIPDNQIEVSSISGGGLW